MKRLPRDQQKKLEDDARLMRAYRAWHREQLEEALAGPDGPMLERLVYILKTLAPSSAPLLLAYIRGVDWPSVNYPTRLITLHEVNIAITKLREKSGQDPFDDGLPGERDNVFRTLQKIVG